MPRPLVSSSLVHVGRAALGLHVQTVAGSVSVAGGGPHQLCRPSPARVGGGRVSGSSSGRGRQGGPAGMCGQ